MKCPDCKEAAHLMKGSTDKRPWHFCPRCHKVFEGKPAKASKYGSKGCYVDEIYFPSQLEAKCYTQLKILQKAGLFKFFLMQVPFLLPGGYKHRVDFAVFYEYSECKFIEAKGRDLAMGKLKRKQVEKIYDIDVHVVRNPNEIVEIVK